MTPESNTTDSNHLDSLLARLDEAVAAMADSPAFAKIGKLPRVMDIARRVLMQAGGCEAIESRIQAMEEAGIFNDSDWETPQILIPALSRYSLQSSFADTVVIEALSELRMLRLATGGYPHAQMSAEQAHHFLTQVLAVNLAMLFTPPTEAERQTQGRLADLSRLLLNYLAERIGFEHIIDKLIEEIWRVLQQRPIQVDGVKTMITQIAICRNNPEIELGTSGRGAERLVSSLFGPTQACSEDPGIEVYQQRLETMDDSSLQTEAIGFARAMHDTGLASAYHPVLIRYLLIKNNDHLLSEALGISSTGRNCLLCYRQLVHALIEHAIYPATAQAVYGLALMLERGILYYPAVAPALWRQLHLPISENVSQRLTLVFGESVPPDVRLLESLLCLLGQPLGVGQGNNATCQSARALSMWSYNDPDYLLQMVTWAARDDEIIIHFEGQPISSSESVSGVTKTILFDLDPVSLIVVPHLDHIYAEMGQRCIDREGDPHRWINPEFHGWSTGRGFRINVDVPSGKLFQLDDFLRHFYAAYHPYYNGNQPIIHPQPAGIAVTDSAARFVGWHAITLLRVALDPTEEIRVYFFNPNNDSGQDWGDGVAVSTGGHGERHGEASLPFEQFASRLYIFHYDPLEYGELARVTREELDRVIGYIHRSWGAERLPEVNSAV